MPLFIENGAAVLCNPADDRSPVTDDDKVATFYAATKFSKGESVPPYSKPATPSHRTLPIHSSAPPSNVSFDKISFIKYTKEIGREYRKQAIELISICRTFAQEQKQGSPYDDSELRSVLQVVDDALYSATQARKKTMEDADAKFNKATYALSTYEKKYHSRKTVTYTMAEAKAKDVSYSRVLKTLKTLKQTWRVGPTMVVEFLLHKSLPDKNPTIVKQVLCQSSDVNEILWNFSRLKDGRRLTLKDNPHFYENLPTSAEKYDGQFRIDPIETFHHNKISVLTDNPRPTGRLFLKTAKEIRAFGNVWVPKDAIKNTPSLWFFAKPSMYDTPWTSLPDRSGPSPTTTATLTPPMGAVFRDWREPILQMLRSGSGSQGVLEKRHARAGKRWD
ncbi:hypothetical protein F5888DRAFT_507428 [Russula emetica]|nr:hypothetical protein F5888DRAFT_507428 [Russula emetica]